MFRSECETSATLKHTYQDSLSLDPYFITNFSLKAIWNFIKGTGLKLLGFQSNEHNGLV